MINSAGARHIGPSFRQGEGRREWACCRIFYPHPDGQRVFVRGCYLNLHTPPHPPYGHPSRDEEKETPLSLPLPLRMETTKAAAVKMARSGG
jgi:hypothetical protein